MLILPLGFKYTLLPQTVPLKSPLGNNNTSPRGAYIIPEKSFLGKIFISLEEVENI